MDPSKREVRMDVEDQLERIGMKSDGRKEWLRASGAWTNHVG
jgi:hypothetical protein